MPEARFIALLVLMGLFLPTAEASDSLNLADALSVVKSDLAAGQTGNVVVLGDSLSVRPGSYIYPLRQMLQNQYGDAGTGWQGMSLQTGAAFDSFGQAWGNSGLIDADVAPYRSLDGLWATSSTGPYNPPSQPLVYDGAFQFAQDQHVQVQYVTGPGGGSFEMLLPDKTTQVVHTAAPTNGIGTIDYTYDSSLAGTDRHFWYQPLGDGPVTILGENNTTGKPGLVFHQAANGGWGVRNFLQRDYTFDSQLKLIHPDLLMIWLGQNDQDLAAAGQFETKMGQLVDRLQADLPSSKILLVSSYDTGSSAMSVEAAADQDLASSRHLGFLNVYNLAGTADYLQSQGYLADGVHPTDAGGQYLATLLYQEWETNGQRQLVGDANHDGAVGYDDLLTLADNYGRANATWAQGDFDGDGKVDFNDLLLLVRDYGQSLTSSQMAQLSPEFRADVRQAYADLPEPTAVTIVGPVALFLLYRRPRRGRILSR